MCGIKFHERRKNLIPHFIHFLNETFNNKTGGIKMRFENKKEHIRMGEYVLTPIQNAFNNKTSYWL